MSVIRHPKQAISVSLAQANRFRSLIGEDARPVQVLNQREVQDYWPRNVCPSLVTNRAGDVRPVWCGPFRVEREIS